MTERWRLILSSFFWTKHTVFKKRQSTHLAFITVEGIPFEDTRVNNNKAIRAMGARGVVHTY